MREKHSAILMKLPLVFYLFLTFENWKKNYLVIGILSGKPQHK